MNETLSLELVPAENPEKKEKSPDSQKQELTPESQETESSSESQKPKEPPEPQEPESSPETQNTESSSESEKPKESPELLEPESSPESQETESSSEPQKPKDSPELLEPEASPEAQETEASPEAQETESSSEPLKPKDSPEPQEPESSSEPQKSKKSPKPQEAKPTESADENYRVFARKYRPKTFDDLYGQDAMVKTLSNAFELGRIAQAWMLTGVRGVGKTTTARILARALNIEIPGEIDKPTIKLDKMGVHCEAIMEGRHVDVIEMDAASHTGINDIREITDSARYQPASARYKVFLIDEVHMLSNAAFNGLLKTLEEPPDHVKFIFATTEIRKVPVTILSRCQRFDLRRIDAEEIIKLLRYISEAESIEISDEALVLIARAGEGSARDSLSLLDQAVAHGTGKIDADSVRSMMGLADRARIIDLIEHIVKGDVANVMAEFQSQYNSGADPAIILTDLADFIHLITRIKIISDSSENIAITESERKRGSSLAEQLSIRILSRIWQILLKRDSRSTTST